MPTTTAVPLDSLLPPLPLPDSVTDGQQPSDSAHEDGSAAVGGPESKASSAAAEVKAEATEESATPKSAKKDAAAKTTEESATPKSAKKDADASSKRKKRGRPPKKSATRTRSASSTPKTKKKRGRPSKSAAAAAESASPRKKRADRRAKSVKKKETKADAKAEKGKEEKEGGEAVTDAEDGASPKKKRRRRKEPEWFTEQLDEKDQKKLGFVPTMRYLQDLKKKKPNMVAAYKAVDDANREKMAALRESAATKLALEEARKAVDAAELRHAEAVADLETKGQVVKHACDAVMKTDLEEDCPWNANYRKLKAYHEAHGNITSLPNRAPDNKELDSLCIWVNRQKQYHRMYNEGKKSTTKPHRAEALEKLGINWNVKAGLWPKAYQQLLDYKAEHGDCIVPTKSQRYKFLGAWVGEQRGHYKKLKEGKPSQLTEERVRLLNEAGFVWNVFDANWYKRYSELEEYRNSHGDCNVPERWSGNQCLSNWVTRQRKEYLMMKAPDAGKRRGLQLTEERVQKLNELGFVWEASTESVEPVAVPALPVATEYMYEN